MTQKVSSLICVIFKEDQITLKRNQGGLETELICSLSENTFSFRVKDTLFLRTSIFALGRY